MVPEGKEVRARLSQKEVAKKVFVSHKAMVLPE